MKKIITILLLLLSGNFIFAETYDLSAFLNLVEQNSKDLKLAHKELDLSKAVKKEAWATALPSIFAQGGYNRNLLENFLYADIPGMGKQKFKISKSNEYSFNAALNQTLFSFKVGNALTAARQYEKLSAFIYEASYQNIRTFAQKGFYQALLLEKVWQLAHSSEENARQNYENVKKKYENGLVSEFELLQAEVHWKNKIPETTGAKKNYEMLMANLRNFAGIPADHQIAFSGSLETYPERPAVKKIKSVLEQRPDFKALHWEKQLRETNVKAQRAEYMPSLSGSFIFAYSSRSDEWKFEDENKNFIAGLSLAIPIYTGGYTGAQLQKARIEVEKSNIKIDQTIENIENELNTISLRLDEAEQRISSARSTRLTAEKAFKIAQVSADNGLITQLELKDSRIFFDQANLNYYGAIYDYLEAYLDWQKAVGLAN